MSICSGIEQIQARYVRMAGANVHRLDVQGLLSEQRDRIELNWELSPRLLEGKRPSGENWRLEKRLQVAEHNTSAEKTLEKAIARLEHWFNQIPTASGLYHHRRDKLRNIDLVHECVDGSYELIELKVRSNTPLEAMLELLTYASLNDVARRRYLDEERAGKELLQTAPLHWRVLAPRAFYGGTDLNLGALADQVSEALRQQGAASPTPVHLDFAFVCFPEAFQWPGSDLDLEAMIASLIPVR